MNTGTLTLSDVFAPRTSLIRDAVLVVGGAALTAVAAQVAIPWQPVPFTLQTLSVYLTGITLGSRRGATAMGLYVGASALGAPILSGGVSLAATSGKTTGYLLGFVVAAALLGWLAEKGWDRKVGTLIGAMVASEALILGLGALFLAPLVGGAANAFKFGVAPFLLPEICKMILVCTALPLAWTFLGKRSGGEQQVP